MTKQTSNKQSTIVKLQTAANGLQEEYPGKSFPLDGKLYKTSDIVGAFLSAIDAIKAGDADKIAWQTTVAKQKAATTTAEALFSALRQYVATTQGKQSQVYKTLGFAPPPAKPTPAVRVAAIKKSAATREALGTRGKQQKKALKAALAAAPVSAPGNGQPGGGNGANGANGASH